MIDAAGGNLITGSDASNSGIGGNGRSGNVEAIIFDMVTCNPERAIEAVTPEATTEVLWMPGVITGEISWAEIVRTPRVCRWALENRPFSKFRNIPDNSWIF